MWDLPKLSPLRDGTWMLLEDFRIHLWDMDITVPKYFITDGASIPRFLWRVCGTPMDVPRLYAAIVHDYLYAEKLVSRKEADQIYRDFQIELGVSKWKAYTEYYALRLFGASHYAVMATLFALGVLTGCETVSPLVTKAAEYGGSAALSAFGAWLTECFK